MRIISVAGLCGLGDSPEVWLPGLLEGRVAPEVAAPERPRRVDRDLWRRMGHLERMAVSAAARACVPGSAPTVGLVWGSGVGSLPASRVYRRSLDAGGPEGASPSAFQVSVHNAAAGFIALALGLTGPAESVFAGGATGLVALLAAENMLRSGAARQVLVVAGDTRSRDSALAHTLAGILPPGDAVCALLLELGEGPGPKVELTAAVSHPDLARQTPLVGEDPCPVNPRRSPDPSLGLVPAIGLWCVGALACGGGGTVADWSGDMVLGARVS